MTLRFSSLQVWLPTNVPRLNVWSCRAPSCVTHEKGCPLATRRDLRACWDMHALRGSARRCQLQRRFGCRETPSKIWDDQIEHLIFEGDLCFQFSKYEKNFMFQIWPRVENCMVHGALLLVLQVFIQFTIVNVMCNHKQMHVQHIHHEISHHRLNW